MSKTHRVEKHRGNRNAGHVAWMNPRQLAADVEDCVGSIGCHQRVQVLVGGAASAVQRSLFVVGKWGGGTEGIATHFTLDRPRLGRVVFHHKQAGSELRLRRPCIIDLPPFGFCKRRWLSVPLWTLNRSTWVENAPAFS